MTDTKSAADSAPHGIRERASETAAAARDTVEQSYRAARDRASRAYDSAADGVEHAIEATRQGARSAARSTAETVDTAPLAVLAGGVAVGLVAGMLLPRSKREAELLAPVGQRLNETAAAAARAARTAGQDQLDALGLNADSARSQVGKLVEGATRAAKEAGTAAAAEVRRTGAPAGQSSDGGTDGGPAPTVAPAPATPRPPQI